MATAEENAKAATALGGTAPATSTKPVIRKPIGVTAPTYDSSGNQTSSGYQATGNYDPRYRMADATGAMPLTSEDKPYAIRPTYLEDDEFMLQSSTKEYISGVQRKMVAAGLMSGNWLLGRWDDNSASAFRNVLAYANQRGFDYNSALDDLVNTGSQLMDRNGKPVGDGLPKRAAFTAQVSNPDDLRKVFKQALYNQTGGNWMDDGEVDKYVQSYQDAETRAQRQQYDQAPYGGTSVDAPKADTMAEDQIKQADAGGVAAEKFAGFGQVLEQLVSQGGI